MIRMLARFLHWLGLTDRPDDEVGRYCERDSIAFPPIDRRRHLVLGFLWGGEMSGRELRAKLGEAGEAMNAPEFYSTMARMEGDGLVVGWYGTGMIGDVQVTERRYRITDLGGGAWERVTGPGPARKRVRA